jgi:transposase
MKAYSIDLRERILQDCDAKMPTREVALKYRVSESWVRRLKQRRRETGEVAPRRLGRKKPAAWLEYADELRACIAEQPDITLRELQAKLGRRVSIQTLSRALRALQLTFKKKSSVRQSRTGRMFGSVALPGKPK